MARAHRYEMLPHVDALLALVEQADAPELMFREIVALLLNRAPIIVEAHVIRSADHVEGVTRLAEALMGHVQAGRASRLSGMRRAVLEAAQAHLRKLEEYVRVERWVEEIDAGWPEDHFAATSRR
jgi:predicted metallo-beta-lactamase superfamily hydrolase